MSITPFITAKSVKFYDKIRKRLIPVEWYVNAESKSKADGGAYYNEIMLKFVKNNENQYNR